MASQINPNNIDGNYPVAGVPNNTQGMRDNFTETRTNFQYAADEITELQNKVVLKQALTGGTLDNDLNDNVLRRAVFRDIAYSLVNIPATSGTITLDYSAGSYQQINPTGPCTLAFTNPPPAGTVGDIFFRFNVTNVSQTLTFPASVSQGLFGIEGISPGTVGVTNTITFGRTGNFTFELITPDGGVTWYLYDLSRPRNKFFGNVVIDNAEAAISTATGALVVDGGVGVGGNLYVGGDIVGNITITGVSVTGNVVGGNINTAGLVSATGNVVGGNLVTVGTISTTGNVNAGNISVTDIDITGNITGAANVTGNVRSGNVTTVGLISAAGNITGGNIRALNQLITAGSIINSNIDTTGNVTADGYVSAVGNVISGNIVTAGVVTATGNVTAGNVVTVNMDLAGNIVGTANVTGNVRSGNVTTVGLISAAGNVTGGNLVTTGNVQAGNLIVSGIQAVTTLNVSGDTLIIGNLTVSGTTFTANVATLVVTDPILGLGRGPNGDPLTTNDGLDRGTEMFYYDTAERIAFMGFDNNEGKMISASNVSVANNIVTVNAYGTTVVGTLEGASVSITGNITGGNIGTAGSVLSSGTGGVGYTAGAGGTVTQLTDKTTAVTLNTISGEITMSNALLGGDTTVAFTLNNSVIAATDVIILNQVGGGNVGLYSFNANCSAGSASIAVHNMTNTNRSDAIVIRFAVIKGATA